jgi:streptogramin lyase
MGTLAKTAQWFGRISVIAWMGAGILGAQTAPHLIYSTYLGGSGGDAGRAVAAGPHGTYVAGTTFSLDFPTFRAAQPDLHPDPDGFLDAFITHFSPTGGLVYSTYLGSLGSEIPLAIAVGPDGTAYVTGFLVHFADDFAFLAKVRPFELSFLPFGGFDSDGRDVAVDSQGSVYVTGRGFYEHPVFGRIPQAFAVKFGSDDTQLYFTPLEGISGDEWGNAIGVDATGHAYVAGRTTSSDFPSTRIIGAPASFQNSNAFTTKLDPSGAIAHSIVFGGSGSDEVFDLATDALGNVFVAGRTTSADFPLLDPVQGALQGPADLFLARFDPDGNLLASTYLGGGGSEEVASLSLDGSGRLYLAGTTTSTDSPLFVPGCSGRFLAELDPETFEVLLATCLPGADVRDMAADPAGALHLTGVALPGLPIVNAFQPQPAGGTDAFAARLTLNRPPDCSAAFADPGVIWPPNGRFVPISIQGVADPEGDLVTIAVTAIRQDEPLTRTGAPDAAGIGTSTPQLRASRQGGGDGRVYRLTFVAEDAAGASCTGTVTVCVPHDQGRGRTCGDGGALFDATR